ncbi:nucleoside deaminase [Arthrobacter deserti]|uniref:Nucleoside deaminase n=1 Tax=Arthrobacter deserti TaxID=1742687 RepID=A0ABX1JX29_9MICC|nr:nucleoside deaminase [Arthrobacter deserti]
MDTSQFATVFSAGIPAWVLEELAQEPEILPTAEDGMRLLIRLGSRNFRVGGGGPFSAMVLESGTGKVVSVGVNRVLASQLSATHAEVTALSLAQTRLGSWDHGAAGGPAHELWVNWRPCAQCYGAVLWSGVSTLVIAGDGPEVEQLTYFDEGPMREDWAEKFRERGIAVRIGVLREEAVQVFRDYRAHVDAGAAVVYNARGTGVNA